ncbi:hypothetical protein SAMN06295909_1761 [Plantibacter sp. VKM Ac-1784]|uniref:Uncharacterized protein n=1 Tax=Plantibacter elymi (nom. nud.) TaxID=199708 RepID=A0ABY1RC25_9MICO|nr:hypothetical protein SAMN06295909_1761 [Plantibacter sp. VKM Ac-1784]
MRAFCVSRALRSTRLVTEGYRSLSLSKGAPTGVLSHPPRPRGHFDKLSDRGEFDRDSGRAADQSGRTGAEPVASATMRRTTSMSVVFSPRRFGLPVP